MFGSCSESAKTGNSSVDEKFFGGLKIVRWIKNQNPPTLDKFTSEEKVGTRYRA